MDEKIKYELGKGGFGEVFYIFDKKSREMFAVKKFKN
jgi:hypothetical protein